MLVHSADVQLETIVVMQVRRLLGTALPGPIRLAPTPDGADAELVTAQQARLMAVAVRTMGLPIGRGALALGGTCHLCFRHLIRHQICMNSCLKGPLGYGQRFLPFTCSSAPRS